MSGYVYGGSRSLRLVKVGGFVIGLLALVWTLIEIGKPSEHEQEDLVVYCAVGMKLPVEKLARRFEEQYGIHIRLEYDSSGGLEAKLQLDAENGQSRADIYIPADLSFAQRAHAKGLLAERIALGSFHLVIAAAKDSSISTLDDMLQTDYVLCDAGAGCGKRTRDTLEKAGRWAEIDAGKKASKPRVTEAANAVALSESVQAAIVWNTEAAKAGLKQITVPELAEGTSSISANIVATSKHPTSALRFARYLASPEYGAQAFSEYGFVINTPGDAWAKTPELDFFCGGVNRTAVMETVREFEQREGCVIKAHYNGCGAHVANMKSGARPDVFMTCDASFMTKVQELFGDATDVSATDIVMVVRKGNPLRVATLSDLANKKIKIGTTDPKVSTMGSLSYEMFKDVGIMESIAEQISTVPSAHELVGNIASHTAIDVALVYRANCNMLDAQGFDLVTINHPLALATQNMATAKQTPYPHLAQRLLDFLRTKKSQVRFEHEGFQWKVVSE